MQKNQKGVAVLATNCESENNTNEENEVPSAVNQDDDSLETDEPNELDKPVKIVEGKGRPIKGMTAFEAGLALLSVIVGGGIVGIPYAMFHTGIPLGLFINVIMALACYYTSTLYLRVKDLSPIYVESLFELGFVTMGAFSIYLISGLITFTGFGCTMIYFIVFSNISKSLALTYY